MQPGMMSQSPMQVLVVASVACLMRARLAAYIRSTDGKQKINQSCCLRHGLYGHSIEAYDLVSIVGKNNRAVMRCDVQRLLNISALVCEAKLPWSCSRAPVTTVISTGEVCPAIA